MDKGLVSVSDELVEVLGRKIASGECPSGTTFTLAELSDEFRLSRTVVREAMRVLQSKGMMVPKRRVGLVVQPSSQWHPFDARVMSWLLDGPYRHDELKTLAEVCSGTGPVAARLAAARREDSSAALMQAYAQRMTHLYDHQRVPEIKETEVALQCEIFRASGNKMFGAFADVVGYLVRAAYGRERSNELLDLGDRLQVYRELADAIEQRDSDRAEELAEKIFVRLTRE
ncbi:MAG: FCD domain-containing protein [Bowdeniella nasicola]|nr:FCD domain-containing protein [Bowdeniella nasicola]